MGVSETAVRSAYADRLERAYRERAELWEVFSGSNQNALLDAILLTPERRVGHTAAVLEAFDFYNTHVMEQDWGSVGAYRADAGGCPTVAVFAHDDGGRCWLEVYDPAGMLLGAARSADGRTVWMAREAIREDVFDDDASWMSN